MKENILKPCPYCTRMTETQECGYCTVAKCLTVETLRKIAKEKEYVSKRALSAD
jgi:hypothetical protein